jgi:nucleoside-diphosphate-sugar epimerase
VPPAPPPPGIAAAPERVARPSMATIAVTGPTGTFGHSLIPLLEADVRVERIVGIARRPFDPAHHGWFKLVYTRGDVRDPDALAEGFAGAEAVAHLASAIYGNASHATLRAINVEGTMNAFHAAARAGVRRFVCASSVAAYGFHADNPVGMTEDWPARGSERLFYSGEKAEIERLLLRAAAEHPDIEVTLFRPTIVLGPHAVGAGEDAIPGPLRLLARGFAGLLGTFPVPLPAVPPPQPLQFAHEADVGQALHLALLGDGPPGIYNLTGDGTLTGQEVWREAALLPLPVPGRVTRAVAEAVMRVPGKPAAFEWAEAATRPLVVDATRAKQRLGWRPAYTSLEALRDTLLFPPSERRPGVA